MFTELAGGLTDLFGAKSKAMNSKLALAKADSYRTLIAACVARDANAVIGVSVDLSVLSNNILVVSSSGTAVRIEAIPE